MFLKRYTKTSVKFGKKSIEIVDSASTIAMHLEIFDHQIYRFWTHSKRPFIIDCGANIGLSIIYFKKLYPNAKIIGFEPDNKVFNTLKKNIDFLQLEDVQIRNEAVWIENGAMSFYNEGADGGRLLYEKSTNNVKTIRLRNFLSQPIDFLKVDIEGAEVEVIEDCSDLLKNVSNIFIEFHSFINREQRIHKILGILNENNFRYYIRNEGVVSRRPFIDSKDYQGMDNQLNIFAVNEA